MLRALVLSDSHRDYYSLERVLRLHPEAEAVFFLGDGEDDFFSPSVQKLLVNKKVTALAGNCDWGSTLPKEELVPLGGKRIFALHGHTRLVKYGLQDLVSEAKARKANVAIYGHTHIARVDYIDGIYFMCPGSVRGGDYGMIDITDKGEIACLTASL